MSEDDESLQLAREEAKILLNNEEVNLEFEIFKSLLILVTDHFNRDTKTKFWALPVRLSLIWAHSARLYDIISPLADSNEEKGKLLKYFNSARPAWSREVFLFEPEFWGDCLHPRFIERQSFLGLAAGRLFTGLPMELLEKIDLLSLLRSLCFWNLDGKSVSHVWLWKDFANRTDAIDSFLGERSFALFNLLFASERDLIIFPSESIQESLTSSLQQILENRLDLDSWSKLIFMTDSLPLNKSLKVDFIQVIRDLDFKAIWEKDNELGLAILLFVVNQKSITPEDIFSRVEGWLKWTVSQLAEKYDGKVYSNSENRPEQENSALFIAEIAARLTVKPFDPLASSFDWNELIFELGKLWSNFSVLLEPTLFHLWLGLSVEQLQGIGKNLLLAKVSRQ